MGKFKKNLPPTLPQKILLRFLRDDLAEEVLGDLDEKFLSDSKNKTRFSAKLNYCYQVLNYLRPFAIRKSKSAYSNHYDMLQNYFKIGWRNMSRQKMYSAIKVGGFAISISACLLITLFIRHELKYDRHYPKGDRIYRVVQTYKTESGVYLPAPFGPALLQDYEEVEQVARINPVELFGAGSNNIRPEGQVENMYEDGFVWADPEFLQMLDFKFVYGNAAGTLSRPNSLVITKSKADKYFPNTNPVGKMMIVANNDKNPFTISGVVEDPPPTSHFHYHFFMTLSEKEFGQGEQTDWLQNNYPTYVLLKPGADPLKLEKKLSEFTEKYILPRLVEINYPNIKEDIKFLTLRLQPIRDIYFEANIGDGLNHGDIRFIWLSGTIVVFILLIACINFINLSTAKSASRAKEVGLRKVVGSVRSHLIKQFLTESLLYSFFSFLLGTLLAWSLMPFFNNLIGKILVFPWQEWWFVPVIASGAFITGILAGLYPSFYLSSFKPIEVLKGNIARGNKSSRLRSTLVVFQFTTSIVLIIGTFIIHRQMQFILNSKIGFDKDQVVLIQGTDLLGDKIKSFKNELRNINGVKYVSTSDFLPVQGMKRNGNTFDNKETPEQEAVVGQFWIVDENYIQTMGMRLIDGRNFADSMATDKEAIIINQAMAKELGYKDPVGKRIANYKDWTIIGVVENFAYESLKENIRPLCFALGESPSITSVKINTADIALVIASISKVWKQFAPHQPMRYTFLDESYALKYEGVQRMESIFLSFTFLTIIIACLGLFGLSSYMMEQRSKEISIRLVLGASIKNIFRLLTMNFVKLVLIAFIIATPLAWYLMRTWLEDFAYKTDITADIFVFAGAMAMIIALITVSYQALRAAFTNPINSLRSE